MANSTGNQIIIICETSMWCAKLKFLWLAKDYTEIQFARIACLPRSSVVSSCMPDVLSLQWNLANLDL